MSSALGLRTGTLQKEMGQVAEQGYHLIALVSRREYVAVFEKSR